MESRLPYTDLLMKMLAIPATSRNERTRADFLEGWLKGMDLQVTRTGNNLLAGKPVPERSTPAILLTSHMDTVSPAGAWKTDPYIPEDSGERITGLGSNDAGGSVVAMIHAYMEVYQKLQDRMNLMLLICAEEEVSGKGGITSVLHRLGKIDGVIVGEPTGMQPAVAERGLMVLDGEVTGRAGHAAGNEGENAIYKAMEDVGSIAGLRFPEKSEWLPDPGAQVTMISAGTAHNVVPALCRFVVDVRSNDKYPNETMLTMLRSVCRASLVPRSMRLGTSVLEPDHFMMHAIRACDLQPFGSSTLSDMALIPFPSVKMGPGHSPRSHSAGEYITKQELKDGVDGYIRFLTALGEIVSGTGSDPEMYNLNSVQ